MQVPNVILDVQPHRVAEFLLIERMKARGLITSVSFGWEKADGCLIDLMPAHQIYRQHSDRDWSWATAVIETDEVVAFIETPGSQVHGTVVGDEDSIARFLEATKTILVPVPPDESQVSFNFWYGTQHGPRNEDRMIDIEFWDAIKENYPVQVRNQLGDLMGWREPRERGQLVLWQGYPGSGKTTALRALASQWQEWCTFHYILDPEALFGKAEYLFEVALQGGASQKWKLLILEDTGELLAADAKHETGQSLSRLLNLVDGILGQGLNIMVLVTTNEDLGALHPAVTRAGRCAAQIEFSSFSVEEAAEWFTLHGLTAPDRPPLVLADMFAAAYGPGDRSAELAFGFTR